MKIPFNIPYVSGNEFIYINDYLNNLPGSGYHCYFDRSINLIKEKWNYNDLYLTSSCTHALEACALLLDIKPGEEVIMPSYTFPSTATAFLRQGAKVVFADSRDDFPGMDMNEIESLITEKTIAIVPVHYAGVSCDMEMLMGIAEAHGLFVIEDAALAIDGYFNARPLGSIGHFGCLSFHKSKNLQCGEGGALIINDKKFTGRAADILEKGTNRREFISGKVVRYEWTEIGSSFLMTELHAAYLLAQLEKASWIKERRLSLWNLYNSSFRVLKEKGNVRLPCIPDYSYHNAHTFYLVLNNQEIMTDLMTFLKVNDIQATVHYTALDQSIFWKRHHTLPTVHNTNSTLYNDCLLRLPLYNSMTGEEIQYVIDSVLKYFSN